MMKLKLILTLAFILFLFGDKIKPEEPQEKEHSLLIYAQSKMSIDDYVSMIRALEIGQKYFAIDKDIVLAVIFIESDFKVKAVNKTTLDYGLTQQNNRYYLARYKHVKKYLDKEKIDCNIDDKYDIYLNVLSAFYYLDLCIKQKGTITQGIKKYNGIGLNAEKYKNKVVGAYYL